MLTAAAIGATAACGSAAMPGSSTPPDPSGSTGAATSRMAPSGAVPSGLGPAGRDPPGGAPGPTTPAISASPLPAPASSTDPTTAGSPASFTGSVAAVDAATAARMATSWRPGCPVPLADLRHLTLTYRGFDGADHTGELIVAASVADNVLAIFRQLYQDGYPIGSMRLVDDFGGDDDASMAANNTSAFNCRPVSGGGGFSEHSYGTAIDVNPVQNPYLRGSTVLPAAGTSYAGRPDAPGVIHDGDDVVRAFAAGGFSWGGDWTDPIDYQHFSVSGR